MASPLMATLRGDARNVTTHATSDESTMRPMVLRPSWRSASSSVMKCAAADRAITRVGADRVSADIVRALAPHWRQAGYRATTHGLIEACGAVLAAVGVSPAARFYLTTCTATPSGPTIASESVDLDTFLAAPGLSGTAVSLVYVDGLVDRAETNPRC